MKKINEVVKYNLLVYLKSNKIIAPLICYLTALVIVYSTKPIEIISSIMVSLGVLFLVTIWLGYSYFKNIDMVSAELIILNTQDRKVYNRGNNITLFIIGGIFSLLGIVVCFLEDAMNGFSLFTRSLTISDLFGSLVLYLMIVLMAVGVIAFYQSLRIKNNKAGFLILTAVSILSIMKLKFIEAVPVSKYAVYLLSPVNKITELFLKASYFSLDLMMEAVIYGLVYSCILIGISMLISKINR